MVLLLVSCPRIQSRQLGSGPTAWTPFGTRFPSRLGPKRQVPSFRHWDSLGLVICCSLGNRSLGSAVSQRTHIPTPWLAPLPWSKNNFCF
jgi:hypothetical protein